ncbi:unnamed protein product [Brassica rapa]|uniref:Uncharacterized protein n=1 Tax=Brassica campestris TaxID=3711 RepID=A0A8D9FZT4_BRACM|nr:unnamed protein product [Brassica rapa]
MDSHGRPVCADGHTWTAKDIMCVLTDSHIQPQTTNVLICVLMDSHGRPVCADGHTRTATDTDTHGQPRTSSVCWRTPTDVLCVLNRQPTWAKITRTVHGKSQHGESKDQRADMCTDGQPRTFCMCTRTHTDSHERLVCADGHTRTQPTWAKITRTVHGKGQRAEASVLSPRTNVLICVLMDSHGRPVCADGHTRTHTDSHERPVHGHHVCADGEPQTATDVMCVLVDTHGRPVCTEQTAHLGQNHPNYKQQDQRADMCTDGQPRTSSTDVLCVLTDTHGRPVQPTWAKITQTVHGKGQPAESKDQRADIQPTWAKNTRTVHGKGQRAESKDQRADMCTDGQPHTSSTDILCVLADTHGRPVCTQQTAHVGQNHPNSPREG